MIFECRPIELHHISTSTSYFTHDEADAVAWAKANTSRDQFVAIEVGDPDDVSTFAIRHIEHDGSDSGWRCWLHGESVVGVSLDRLFVGVPS